MSAEAGPKGQEEEYQQVYKFQRIYGGWEPEPELPVYDISDRLGEIAVIALCLIAAAVLFAWVLT